MLCLAFLLFATLIATSRSFSASFQPHSRSYLTLSSSATTTDTSAEWDIFKAQDSDMSTVLTFFEQKAIFDRSLTGDTPSKFKRTPGNTLQTLFPYLPNGQIWFISEPSEQGAPQNDPIGFALFNFQYRSLGGRPVLNLFDIFVSKKCRSGGAGRALMDQLIEVGGENYATHMEWEVDEDNRKGMSFYERLGATYIGQENRLKQMAWTPDEWN